MAACISPVVFIILAVFCIVVVASSEWITCSGFTLS